MTKSKNLNDKHDANFHGSSHITQHGTNIFLDLGFSPEQAAKYHKDSQRKIADMLVKRKLKT